MTMTDVETVRLIITDAQQFDRAEAVGDGVNTQFPLPNAPIVGSSVLTWVDGTPTVPSIINYRMGLITFAAAPGDGLPVVITYTWSILLDEDIQAFLDMEGGNVKLAAAQALDTIASSEVLVEKRITLLDLQTDGPATARELRAHAKALRDQAAAVTTDADVDGTFDYAELGLPPFGDVAYYYNQKRRAGEL